MDRYRLVSDYGSNKRQELRHIQQSVRLKGKLYSCLTTLPVLVVKGIYKSGTWVKYIAHPIYGVMIFIIGSYKYVFLDENIKNTHLTSKSPRSSCLPMYCRISLREQVLFRKYANPPVMPMAFLLVRGR